MNDMFDLPDRFVKLRLGKITSVIDDNGLVNVLWLDQPGGQNEVNISYPCYDNSQNGTFGWGIEYGFGEGMIGLFGFLSNNHAVLLGTWISRVKNASVGYDKTKKIKTGEFRFSSKAGAEIHLDLTGGISITGITGGDGTVSPSIYIAGTGEVGITGAQNSSVLISKTGEISIVGKTIKAKTAEGNSSLQMTDDTITITQGNSNKIVLSDSGAVIGSGSETILDGAVTKQCICSFTGAPHPDASTVTLIKKI